MESQRFLKETATEESVAAALEVCPLGNEYPVAVLWRTELRPSMTFHGRGNLTKALVNDMTWAAESMHIHVVKPFFLLMFQYMNVMIATVMYSSPNMVMNWTMASRTGVCMLAKKSSICFWISMRASYGLSLTSVHQRIQGQRNYCLKY